jgi:hypothetical protein
VTGISAVRFGLAQCAIIAVLVASAAVRLGEHPTLVVVCLVTSAAALVLPVRWAALLGLVAWAFFTGFVTNRLGQLTFRSPDLARLALLVAVGSTAHWAVWTDR